TLFRSQPNTFSPMNAQGLYRDDLWRKGHQLEDFASRYIFMLGSTANVGSSVESGVNKSRTNLDSINSYSTKYWIGEAHIGSLMRGGSFWDVFNVIGGVSFGSTNFYDSNDMEQPGSESYRRIHANMVEGSESYAAIGRRISPDMSPEKNQGYVDVRNHNWREDDAWNIMPAVV